MLEIRDGCGVQEAKTITWYDPAALAAAGDLIAELADPWTARHEAALTSAAATGADAPPVPGPRYGWRSATACWSPWSACGCSVLT